MAQELVRLRKLLPALLVRSASVARPLPRKCGCTLARMPISRNLTANRARGRKTRGQAHAANYVAWWLPLPHARHITGLLLILQAASSVRTLKCLR